jgi:hypothetical protein
MDFTGTDYRAGVIDLAARRVQRLEDEEVGLLGRAVGEHLAVELGLGVEALRAARTGLVRPGPLAA